MKTVGGGAFGSFFGCMWISRGRRLPLRRLQVAQAATMFSQTDLPPRLLGITWSTVSPDFVEPQYWQVQESRARTARRGILRRWASRGVRPELVRRITSGRSIVMCSECRAPPLRRSRSSAFSFRSRTAARRNVQTLIGSYVALSTRTLAMPAGNCRAPGACSSSSQGIGAKDPDRIGLPPQLRDRLGHGGIIPFALEVAEEH